MSRWPLRRTYFWQEAPFFHLLLPMIVAIISYDLQWISFNNFLCLVLLAGCTIAFTSFSLPRKQGTFQGIVLVILFYTIVFTFGLWRTAKSDIQQDKQWFARAGNRSQVSLVRLSGDPVEKERVWRMPVQILKSMQANGIHQVHGNAILYVYKKDAVLQLASQDLVLVPARWTPIQNPGNPFEFDAKTFYKRKNILHQQFIGPDDLQLYERHNVQDISRIDRLHQYCTDQLRYYVADSAALGLLQAMLLGDEGNFDPALRQAYADTGVIHIVSISGSHVAVLFLVVTTLLFWLKGKKGRWIKYSIGVLVVWIYVLMAGAPPSALRSAIMFTVVALSITTVNESNTLNTLLAAAFLLLCANPMWLFAVGFQLSFVAVLSLILFYAPIASIWPQTTLLGKWTWNAIAASMAAELLTAPLVIYYFHNFPLFFLVANLLSVVLVGICVLVGGMAIISFSWLPPLATAIARLVTILVTCFNELIFFLQSWNPRSFKYLQLSLPALLLVYISITLLALYFIRQIKQCLFLALGTASILFLLLSIDKAEILKQERLVVYNISRHNRAELIQGNSFRTLYNDTVDREHYITRQAHTGWQSWLQHTSPKATTCFYIKGRKVLLLVMPLYVTKAGAFPVDVLIVLHSLKKTSTRSLQETFHPKLLVAGAQPRWLLDKIRDSCKVLQLPFHAVGQNGAFVME